MRPSVRSIPVAGETIRGEHVLSADVREYPPGFDTYIRLEGDGSIWSPPMATIDEAEASIRAHFDSAPPKPIPTWVLPVQTEALALIDRFGEFVHQRAEVDRLAHLQQMFTGDAIKLRRLIKKTLAKSEQRRQTPAAVDAVDWSDATVERAIRVLTGSDQDHATVRNDIGWNGSDSSTGHWCRAMLEEDLELALRVGRGIVGKYQRQLHGAGVL